TKMKNPGRRSNDAQGGSLSSSNIIPNTTDARASHPPAADGEEAFMVEAAREIHKRLDRIETAVADAVEVGRWLTEVKDRLPHGEFLPWQDREFSGRRGWTDRSCRNYMFLYQFSKSEKFSDLTQLPASTLVLLAAPSTPREVIDDVIAQVQA